MHQSIRVAQTELVVKLSSVLAQWQRTGIEPDIIGVFSSGERAAIYLAAGEYKLLPAPLGSFLRLEDSLQRWILEEHGLTRFIGTTIAGNGP